MATNDRDKDSAPEDTHPIDPPVSDDERYRLGRTGPGGVTDAGRTMGGGSLGHVAPDDTEREAPLRNNADDRPTDEPTMPSKDSSVNTKI
jgi:hypothetical protein